MIFQFSFATLVATQVTSSTQIGQEKVAGRSVDDVRPLFFWVKPESEKSLGLLDQDEVGGVTSLFSHWVNMRWALLQQSNSTWRREAFVEIGAAEVFESMNPLRRDRFVFRYLLDGDRRLLHVAGPGKKIILAWTSGEKQFVELSINLALSIRSNAAHLEQHFCVIAVDSRAEQALKKVGVCALRPETWDVDLSRDGWDFKIRLLNTCLVLGLDALILDTDTILLGDPFGQSLYHDSDLETGTDHFFPDRDLFRPFIRREENINTGFLFSPGSKPDASAKLFCFLVGFMDVFEHSDWIGLGRDMFDQRAFNTFVFAHLASNASTVMVKHGGMDMTVLPSGWPPERLAVRGLLNTSRDSCDLCRSIQAKRHVTIRILEPEEVAHGMNFFWRRTQTKNTPVFVHANGVNDKLYFMRDRSVWYITDWDVRFGSEPPRFVEYTHTRNLQLADDFKLLLCALEVAIITGRRLVLPRTMNCKNSPAYKAFGLQLTDCTFDHFASANILLHYYNASLVESSIVDVQEYKRLRRTSQSRTTSDLILQDLFSEVAVVDLGTDIAGIRDAARAQKGLSTADSPFSCKYAYWPGRQMACRDEVFVQHFSAKSRCEPGAFQEACGVRGFSCCEVFHGWAEKLESFTGQPWHLPCNCGLDDICDELSDKQNYPQLTNTHKCCFHRHEDQQIYRCFDIGTFPDANPSMDFNSYSSDKLWAFMTGLIGAADVYNACERWTQTASVTMSLSTKPEDIGRDCTWLISTFLLYLQKYDRLVVFLDFMLHTVRRPVWKREVVTTTMATGVRDDNVVNIFKLHHDAAHIEYLANQRPGNGKLEFAKNITLDWVTAVFLPKLEGIIHSIQQRETWADIQRMFSDIEGVYNRPLFMVPSFGAQAAVFTVETAERLREAASKLESGITKAAWVDDAVDGAVLVALQWLMQASSIWFGITPGGEQVSLQTSLLDGLHHPQLLKLAREMREAMPSLVDEPLRDIQARKILVNGRSSGLHAFDAKVVACLFLLPQSDPTLNGGRGGAVKLVEEEMPGLADDVGEGEVAQIGNGTIPTIIIPFKPNRLTIWRGDSGFLSQESHNWPVSYGDARVEVYFLFGNHRKRPV